MGQFAIPMGLQILVKMTKDVCMYIYICMYICLILTI